MLRILTLSLILLFTTSIASAQSAVTLLADSVLVQGSSTLVAEGNVEVLYNGTQLQASRVTYFQSSDTIQIEGPLVLRDDENTVLLANSAELDVQLRNGILSGARLVLNEQLQLAAAEINLVGGKYTQLSKVAATSCHVCGTRPPLWQIRATKVVHDIEEQQIYFDNAQLRVMDFPILWLPRLRIPDPTLDRATGFLIPKLRSTSRLGTGIKLPYFMKLGDYRDLTVTPYWSPVTRTIEARYRQNFVNGSIQVESAFTKDDILPNQSRGYFFGKGTFDFANDYVLRFDLETSSDDAYLLDYGYSGKDRLDSAISLSRIHSDNFFNAELINYYSLRDTENNFTLPTWVGEVVYERRFIPSALGGELNLKADLHGSYRESTADGVLGRDVARVGLQAGWVRDWTLLNGMIFETHNQLNLDYFNTVQDSAFPENATSALPILSAKLSWPLVKTTTGGATHILTPTAQLMWSEDFGDNFPNEESTRVEFDEGNLFSLSRFPANDIRESGFRGNFGVTWNRFDPKGWQATMTLGRVFTTEANANFSKASGLSRLESDWLLSGQLDLTNGIDVTARALLADDLSITKAEAKIGWAGPRTSLNASYTYVIPDADENRLDQINELDLNGTYRVNQNWTTTAGVRYSFEEERAASANLGVTYEHECVEVKFSSSRRFTSSSSIEPTTDYDLSIGLRGFTANTGGKTFAPRCTK